MIIDNSGEIFASDQKFCEIAKTLRCFYDHFENKKGPDLEVIFYLKADKNYYLKDQKYFQAKFKICTYQDICTSSFQQISGTRKIFSKGS